MYYALIQYADDALTEEEALHEENESNITTIEKKELNSLLYREYSLWYDAFVAEAEEDVHDTATADDRFSWHCANILSRKTGVPADEIAPMVCEWIVAKA